MLDPRVQAPVWQPPWRIPTLAYEGALGQAQDRILLCPLVVSQLSGDRSCRVGKMGNPVPILYEETKAKGMGDPS